MLHGGLWEKVHVEILVLTGLFKRAHTQQHSPFPSHNSSQDISTTAEIPSLPVLRRASPKGRRRGGGSDRGSVAQRETSRWAVLYTRAEGEHHIYPHIGVLNLGLIRVPLDPENPERLMTGVCSIVHIPQNAGDPVY